MTIIFFNDYKRLVGREIYDCDFQNRKANFITLDNDVYYIKFDDLFLMYRHPNHTIVVTFIFNDDIISCCTDCILFKQNKALFFDLSKTRYCVDICDLCIVEERDTCQNKGEYYEF